MLPLFDIFSGHFLRKDARWIEACGGSANAVQRMLEIAAKKPGPYFLFSCYTRRCVMSLDTTSYVENSKAQLAVAPSRCGLLGFIN
jgi:hypothetical protein